MRANRGHRGELAVDRTACTGQGVCAHLLDGAVSRDEWGYPIIVDPVTERGPSRVAVALCPAGALRWTRIDDGTNTPPHNNKERGSTT